MDAITPVMLRCICSTKCHPQLKICPTFSSLPAKYLKHCSAHHLFIWLLVAKASPSVAISRKSVNVYLRHNTSKPGNQHDHQQYWILILINVWWGGDASGRVISHQSLGRVNIEASARRPHNECYPHSHHPHNHHHHHHNHHLQPGAGCNLWVQFLVFRGPIWGLISELSREPI